MHTVWLNNAILLELPRCRTAVGNSNKLVLVFERRYVSEGHLEYRRKEGRGGKWGNSFAERQLANGKMRCPSVEEKIIYT
jgi:hypothetical protein